MLFVTHLSLTRFFRLISTGFGHNRNRYDRQNFCYVIEIVKYRSVMLRKMANRPISWGTMNHATALLPPDIQALRENLTDFQARFAEEYLVDLNASQAAVRAGSTATRPGQTGFDTLKLPEVAEYVGALQRLRSERTEIDADWVLRESTKLYQRCVNDKRVLTDRKGMPILDEDGQLQWVFNATGAAKALELVGKHVNIQAFKENVGLSGAIGVAVVDARALSDEQLRALAAIPIGPKAPGGD